MTAQALGIIILFIDRGRQHYCFSVSALCIGCGVVERHKMQIADGRRRLRV